MIGGKEWGAIVTRAKMKTRLIVDIVLFILIVAALLFFVTSHSAPKTKSDEAFIGAQLIDEYQHFNDGYFDGELPRDTKITYRSLPNSEIGLTIYNGDGRFDIFINAYYDRTLRDAELSLAHETCHGWVYVHGGEPEVHGPKWVGCMRRLASEGALDSLW